MAILKKSDKLKLARLAQDNADICKTVATNSADLKRRYGSIFGHPVAWGFAAGIASKPLKFLTFRRLRLYLISFLVQEFRQHKKSANNRDEK